MNPPSMTGLLDKADWSLSAADHLYENGFYSR